MEPLFLLSFRHRDELAQAASRAGWQPIAARRQEDANRRFVSSGAVIAVVDARGALEEGIASLTALAGAAEANASGLLMLLSRGDVGALDRVFAAGATHYLASPFGDDEFAQALRFVARHAERVGGQRRPDQPALSWELDTSTGSLALSEPLAERLKVDPPSSFSRFMRLLDKRDRRAAVEAARRLDAGDVATAFAHTLPGGGRAAHHLSRADEGERIGGRIEQLEDGQERRSGGRDVLTGLADGVAARHWIARRLGEGRPVTLLQIALARFDGINEAYGRAAGDALLTAAARRVERLSAEVVGRGGLVARIAGAEFLIGVAGDDMLERVRLLASQLLDALARPFVADTAVLTLGSHGGITESLAGETEPGDLLRRASAALSDARIGDGDPIRVLAGDKARDEQMSRRLEADLREALAGDGIEILYQPQARLPDGAIVGVEALARWRHPTLGLLGAETLFAAGEGAGLSLPLSNLLQRRAIEGAVAWPPALQHLTLSINVTAADVAQPDFDERVLALTDETGFPRHRLTIEVTEGDLIADLAQAADLLAKLRAARCRVAIDDFGTGYSSLAYLKALPLDYLKIDKRLAQDIAGTTRDRVVVRGVIEMARSLGLRVVAEGVETAEQLALLAAEGCTSYQGYLCAPPLSTDELVTLVAPVD
ncbi:EAL domain-containing protein (putative c-di-GMP-specific phosphodiesterase class I)/GGDEF domain-containing protein/DNA-binding response OmpR family regulator [Sphingomonas jejuensis]|uniref:EAL domain-containing protein (Putative c-di-GMP-specific phosphodiesterase class I)/GGDEF domain-containing protein/DNA-binding response OmpR family regulator n=1 Tax=Sphingomonas jejuensis TaxID=904715 RepID=A0ABX0XJL9_9SPHN|nr:bifunctional diguanylate cyclase/phosphodiesterase [Sphingomonas jejuensis]NJC33435.1 EAL domain-containing protein (putative c-di-GMP-specific phosphodiesterase class I)/GGDEF domain-containing protein/DNA-binding response OmpR family regulator [Sphingomonas jejuensis]